uniref:CCT-eta n=1 Tax=Colobus angolensis palliatus TaxID=336983 RepID=A0A2K5JE15_COLAP
MMPTLVILLKEGTDSSQGISQLVNNLSACQVIAKAIRTTLGAYGMDELIVDGRGKATISNDVAIILKLLDVVHPAAKTLVDFTKSQDTEVGDGTTSLTLLTAEFLKQLAVNKIREIAVTVKEGDKVEQRKLLDTLVVEAVMMLNDLLQLKMIGIKKVQGGALEDSQLVADVAFKNTFSYAGFEMQLPKKYYDPKIIALLNTELQWKAEKDNAEIRVHTAIVDVKENILYDKLERIHHSGAKVVLSKLPTGDVATQYFADRDMFCAGPVPEENLKRMVMACEGSIQTSANALSADVLGERYNFFVGCPKAKTCTFILCGGAKQFMEETERSLHDAIRNESVVADAGVIERELFKYLQDSPRAIPGKEQLLIGAYAKALEITPHQPCNKAGFDATKILNKLQAQHVDINNEDIADNFEPAMVWINALAMGSHYIAQLKLLSSRDPPTSASQSVGNTGVSPCTQPIHKIF